MNHTWPYLIMSLMISQVVSVVHHMWLFCPMIFGDIFSSYWDHQHWHSLQNMAYRCRPLVPTVSGTWLWLCIFILWTVLWTSCVFLSKKNTFTFWHRGYWMVCFIDISWIYRFLYLTCLCVKTGRRPKRLAQTWTALVVQIYIYIYMKLIQLKPFTSYSYGYK